MMAEVSFAAHATDNDPDLQYVRMLGAGAFGSVHEVLYIPGQRSFARKLLLLPSRERRFVEKEVRAIQKLCGPGAHVNIVQVLNHGLLWDFPYYYIDMELCDMNLQDYIQSTSPADPSKLLPPFIKGGGIDSLLQIWTVMSQIASGVEYIHYEQQIHRDIKPGNVLFSFKSSVWKLADFGLSSEGSSQNLPTKYSSGTPGYRAPELMSSDGDTAMYNNKVDIWGMGCILYELSTGTRAFKTDHGVISYSLLHKNKEVVLDNTFDSDSVKTITKHIIDMLQIDPLHRPSASFLSKEFDQQLQLARHVVLLRASDSVTVEAKSDRCKDEYVSGSQKKTPLHLPKEFPDETVQTTLPVVKVHEDLVTPAQIRVPKESVPSMPMNHEPPQQTPTTPQEDQVRANPNKRNLPSLPPHLIGMSLYDVAERGDIDGVKALLNTKGNIDAEGELYEFGNPLQVASYRGHEAVVRLLLEKGADVNAEGGYWGNALQAASHGGYVTLVQLLLEKGAEVNAQGGYLGNALRAASSRGHEAVVRLLLEKGAEENAEGGGWDNALQVASFEGHEAVVRLLLEKGADVNAEGGYWGNALQAASSRGHEAVVRLLLEKGADVNAEGGWYGNALEAASRNKYHGVVALLLENGARS